MEFVRVQTNSAFAMMYSRLKLVLVRLVGVGGAVYDRLAALVVISTRTGIAVGHCPLSSRLEAGV